MNPNPLLRVRLHVLDLDAQESWFELLDDQLLWVDTEPAVVLTDQLRPPFPEVPTVVLAEGEARSYFEVGFAGVVRPDAPVEQVIGALNAVVLGLQVSTPGDAATGSPPELTPREQEVLELLAQGFSNPEIGRALEISSHTAKFHVQALLDKLDATTRTEAAVRAARLFII
jgi:DNA-binding NarL/FixJ family response regulator